MIVARATATACFAAALWTVAAQAADSPIVRRWTEKTPSACQAATGDVSAPQLRELVFKGDGKFSVTWMPFETYEDYWGTYSFDPATEVLILTVSGGNHIPKDARLRGNVHFGADGMMLMSDMLLGTSSAGVAHTSTCPLVFGK